MFDEPKPTPVVIRQSVKFKSRTGTVVSGRVIDAIRGVAALYLLQFAISRRWPPNEE